MPTRIKPDFKPSDRVYELMATRYGITTDRAREFIGHELGDFMMYWEGRTDAGAAKANWDSTCLNWMKKQYEDKKEQMAQHRPYGKQKDNVFQEVVGNMIASDLPQAEIPARRQARIRNAPIPGDGQTMSREEALDQLAKMRRTG